MSVHVLMFMCADEARGQVYTCADGAEAGRTISDVLCEEQNTLFLRKGFSLAWSSPTR